MHGKFNCITAKCRTEIYVHMTLLRSIRGTVVWNTRETRNINRQTPSLFIFCKNTFFCPIIQIRQLLLFLDTLSPFWSQSLLTLSIWQQNKRIINLYQSFKHEGNISVTNYRCNLTTTILICNGKQFLCSWTCSTTTIINDFKHASFIS